MLQFNFFLNQAKIASFTRHKSMENICAMAFLHYFQLTSKAESFDCLINFILTNDI